MPPAPRTAKILKIHFQKSGWNHDSVPRLPLSDVATLLRHLTSEKCLPTQISEIRHKLKGVSRALNQPGNCFSDTVKEAMQISLGVEDQLEQLEVDLVAGHTPRTPLDKRQQYM